MKQMKLLCTFGMGGEPPSLAKRPRRGKYLNPELRGFLLGLPVGGDWGWIAITDPTASNLNRARQVIAEINRKTMQHGTKVVMRLDRGVVSQQVFLWVRRVKTFQQ